MSSTSPRRSMVMVSSGCGPKTARRGGSVKRPRPPPRHRWGRRRHRGWRLARRRRLASRWWWPSGVQLLYEVVVALGDHRALDLQGRRELAGGLGEVVVEDREALDLLDAGQALVDGVDRRPELGVNGRMAGQRCGIVRRGADPLGQLDGLVGVERQQRDEVGLAV